MHATYYPGHEHGWAALGSTWGHPQTVGSTWGWEATAFGDTHKVKIGVKMGKKSFRWVVVPKRRTQATFGQFQIGFNRQLSTKPVLAIQSDTVGGFFMCTSTRFFQMAACSGNPVDLFNM